ncbi:MAG: type II secretion system F family protein [Acidimicrobiia bacterium]|nr:type II secretion system F family protein [Acidimicrobiia bacterium]MBV8983471.1 type II secretion system F family protein [Acidimicrobiia bacterium]MBV9040577.1 type II secretion system F family protein [Acidimicrobiia bacterium]
MLLLTFIAVFLSICLAVYAVVGSAEEKATIRESLRQLGGYEIENERDRELLDPLRQRAVVPVVNWFTGIGRRLTPVGYVDGIRRKLTLAGNFTPENLDRFLAIRVVTLALIPVWAFLAFGLLSTLGNSSRLGVFVLLTLGSILGPDAILNRKVAERQHEIQVRLPDILDLLTISVEAGLGFEQALDRTIAAVPGPLSEEFARMLGEVRAGASRADAMRAMDERIDVPEVRSFVLAILQADTFGVSIGRVLRAQADEMRIKRRQLAQEQALKAPVKMLFPMVFCIFPALFVVVIGPAIINISKGFK